jgi:hypothetical protein
MGACCSDLSVEKAYRHAFNNPVLEEIAPQLPDDTIVVVLRLLSIKKLGSGNMNDPHSGIQAYCEFQLKPEDPFAGKQCQFSSVRPDSRTPTWVSSTTIPYSLLSRYF